MTKKKKFEDYTNFLRKVSYGQMDGVDVTHDGYPLSVKEAKFIDLFIANGNLPKALRAAGLSYKSIAGKDYITDEITYRLDALKSKTIADADEIMQYFTKVMRGQEKDQFGLDAPLAERTRAAQELAKRQIDAPSRLAGESDATVTIKLDWGDSGLPTE